MTLSSTDLRLVLLTDDAARMAFYEAADGHAMLRYSRARTFLPLLTPGGAAVVHSRFAEDGSPVDHSPVGPDWEAYLATGDRRFLVWPDAADGS